MHYPVISADIRQNKTDVIAVISEGVSINYTKNDFGI